MAARAMWKGVIVVGGRKVPVKLYSAVQDRDVHFTLLSRTKHQPVEQRMVKPDEDESVPYEEIKKGYFTDGSYVMLEKEELQKLAPKPSRDIEVTRFVGDEKLGPEWFVRPYYLGPDGDEESYFALARALADAEREGIARWVMRNTEYTGVLRAAGDYLMLMTLRHQDEVVSTESVHLPSGRTHNDKEAKMAEQLVMAFDDEFDPEQFKNEHRERVLELIEAKSKGKRLRLKQVQEKKSEPSLLDALSRSLAGLQKAAAANSNAASEDKPAAKKSVRAPKKSAAKKPARKRARKESAVA